MTESEHETLVEVGNFFWDELSRLVAKCVEQMPRHLEHETLAYLQDRASVYGCDYRSYLHLQNTEHDG